MFGLILREIERLERDVLSSFDHYLDFSPNYNVSEDKGVYTLSFLLPGLSKDDIDIVYKDRVLTVRGDGKSEGEELSDNNVSDSSKFEHSFRFRVDIDPESIAADYKDGVLLIKANRAKSSEPLRIKAS